MKPYLERLVKTENEKRTAQYQAAFTGWKEQISQDRAYQLNPRPFPPVPFAQEVVSTGPNTDFDWEIVESLDPVCKSLISFGPGNILVW